MKAELPSQKRKKESSVYSLNSLNANCRYVHGFSLKYFFFNFQNYSTSNFNKSINKKIRTEYKLQMQFLLRFFAQSNNDIFLKVITIKTGSTHHTIQYTRNKFKNDYFTANSFWKKLKIPNQINLSANIKDLIFKITSCRKITTSYSDLIISQT